MLVLESEPTMKRSLLILEGVYFNKVIFELLKEKFLAIASTEVWASTIYKPNDWFYSLVL
ncbi:MAG TPA: hypothetical protein VE944_11260 [Nostoc sp.]|uniref:hypothetical protein n=1 Tax=Nostoc sp. TaxID=1180 RepID=UPI002D7489C9|nr:hypothetical protein [Nostoc sp.]HYX14921.1 hypothetical protein [Nostoc sp.]